MDRKPRKISFGTHVGTSLILLIFTVLCLISFATLSLVNANADWKLTNKLVDRQYSYLDACTQANCFLSARYVELSEIRENAGSEEEYLSAAESLTLSAQYPLNENQVLMVEIEPVYEESLYRVQQYRVITLQTAAIDDTLPLYTGD
ncbi:MAG: hypothetical protein IJT34_03640 [Butyrivibrio sp.]|nr:hypothetical protein [Butyrivibrio sp.]